MELQIERNRILNELNKKLPNYHLGSGTALSQFYFHHRQTSNLCFYSKEYSSVEVITAIFQIPMQNHQKINLIAQENEPQKPQMTIYRVELDEKNSFNIAFFEDKIDLINEPAIVNEISIYSKEDIYLRKILSICEYAQIAEEKLNYTQIAEDIFDIFFLSKTFVPFSKFVEKHCTVEAIENLIIWPKIYNETSLQNELNNIQTDKDISLNSIQKYLNQETDIIIENLIKATQKPQSKYDKELLQIEELKESLEKTTQKKFLTRAIEFFSKTRSVGIIFSHVMEKDIFCLNWQKAKKLMIKKGIGEENINFWDQIYKSIKPELDLPKEKREKQTKPALDKKLLEIGQTIKNARKKLNMTQKDLSVKTDISQQTISFIENGYLNLTLLTLKKISDCLGLQITLD